MHYSYRIARENMDPATVPAMAGVDINWVHRDARGAVNLAASRAAASAMVGGYQIVFSPARDWVGDFAGAATLFAAFGHGRRGRMH